MTAEQILLARYEETTPSIRRRGRTWYPELRRLLEVMAEEHRRPPAQVVAICAITSSDTQLVTNLRWTEEILRGEREAGRYPSFQIPQIAAALRSAYPGRHVRGPKCGAFYRAIMGDTQSLVLDRWAALAAGHKRRRALPNGLRRELDAAYRVVAAECEETVRAFQAMVWILVRESTPKTVRGQLVVPRLVDITE